MRINMGIRTTLLLVIVCLQLLGTSAIQCYMCEQTEEPVGSACWNASEALPTMECEHSCYTSMFQSGGNEIVNYWNVKRGCKAECSPSENCRSQHYGACQYCCGAEMCNTYILSSAHTLRTSWSLTVSLLAALVFYFRF